MFEGSLNKYHKVVMKLKKKINKFTHFSLCGLHLIKRNIFAGNYRTSSGSWFYKWHFCLPWYPQFPMTLHMR